MFVLPVQKFDLYIPAHNIVVECDENGHVNYNLARERRRTRIIKEQLSNPIFVRYNPDEADFDLFGVIGEIYQHIRASRVKKHQRHLP